MSDIDLNKLKVTELRGELAARGLDTKGVKAVLVKRLRTALNNEAKDRATDDEVASSQESKEEEEENLQMSTELNDSAASTIEENSFIEEKNQFISEPVPTEVEEAPSAVSVDESAAEAEAEVENSSTEADQDMQCEESLADNRDKVDEATIANKPSPTAVEDQPLSEDTVDETSPETAEVLDPVPIESDMQESSVSHTETPMIKETEQKEIEEPEPISSENMETEAESVAKEDEKTEDVKSESDHDNLNTDTEKIDNKINQEEPSTEIMDNESSAVEQKPVDDETRGIKRKHDELEAPMPDAESGNLPIKKERLPGKERRTRWDTQKVEKEEPEVEVPVIDDTAVLLDTYNSDLNLVIGASRTEAYPLTDAGFAFMWSGVRASYGVKSDKVYFEMKVIKHLDVSHLPEDEPNPHVVRVGFSVEESTLQLGEDPLSYGYGGTGKISTNCQFTDYGTSFAEGDCVAAFLDMDSDSIKIGFAKNGEFLDWAYTIEKSKLEEKVLFPHILTKNCSFEVNFGKREEPFFALPEALADFVFIDCLPLEKRIRGIKSPDKREECEMIMMCGLPGAGKTVWAAKYAKENAAKKYNVLGTNNIIDKMKVMGLPRKRNYHGRWDVLIQMATKCLNKLFEIGSKQKRNYILDQTNVYPTAQRRKMRNFEGYIRKAVVVVPDDEEYKRRCDQRDREEGKEVPDHAVMEMKANFKLPESGDIFDDIIFSELQRGEAEALIRTYNEEGRAAVGPPEKRFRPQESLLGNSPIRDARHSGGYERERHDVRDRGNPDSRSSWRDRPPHGNFGPPARQGYDNRGGFGNRGGYGGFDGGRGGRGGMPRGGRGGFMGGNRNNYGGDGGYNSRGNDNYGPPSRGGFGNGGGSRYGGYDDQRNRSRSNEPDYNNRGRNRGSYNSGPNSNFRRENNFDKRGGGRGGFNRGGGGGFGRGGPRGGPRGGGGGGSNSHRGYSAPTHHRGSDGGGHGDWSQQSQQPPNQHQNVTYSSYVPPAKTEVQPTSQNYGNYSQGYSGYETSVPPAAPAVATSAYPNYGYQNQPQSTTTVGTTATPQWNTTTPAVATPSTAPAPTPEQIQQQWTQYYQQQTQQYYSQYYGQAVAAAAAVAAANTPVYGTGAYSSTNNATK